MPPKKPIKRPDFSGESGHSIVCGMDEVGRGPLAGPVVAACVYIPEEKRNHPVWLEVNDSKKLSLSKREMLFDIIQAQSCFSIAQCSVDEIDDINILQASLLAMKRACEQMCAAHNLTPGLALVDGNKAPQLAIPCQTVIGGDALSCSIAAASILAKVTRDRIMESLHAEFPQYGWQTNAGYGTPEHLEALQSHGPSAHHRKSFAPVRELIRSVAA